jgi:3-oxoacid CoA-transferase subunit A
MFHRPSDLVGADKPQSREREYVLESGLYADLALVKAHTSDAFGNLIYRATARNFNPMMATAARFVAAEVEEAVPLGEIEADRIHTPGAFVDCFVVTESEKRIEQRTTRSG